MILQADVKGLEVVAAAFLSKDKVLYEELNSGVDIHSNNQIAFNLPQGDEGRLVAKKFKFRILYGGRAYSFTVDNDFSEVSTNEAYWQDVIDKYYTKYSGIAKWHKTLLETVSRDKRLEMCTGRVYTFDIMKDGKFKLPEQDIKNYPVRK